MCVGSAEAVSQGLTVAGKGSSVNVFGGLKSGTLLEVDAGRVHYDEVVLTGSFGFSPDQFKTALALLSSGRVDVENFITHVFSLDARRPLRRLPREGAQGGHSGEPRCLSQSWWA